MAISVPTVLYSVFIMLGIILSFQALNASDEDLLRARADYRVITGNINNKAVLNNRKEALEDDERYYTILHHLHITLYGILFLVSLTILYRDPMNDTLLLWGTIGTLIITFISHYNNVMPIIPMLLILRISYLAFTSETLLEVSRANNRMSPS